MRKILEKKDVVVNSEMEGMRLDRYLRKNFKDEPLSRIFGAIRSGDVKINGKKSKENYRLLLNDKITIRNLSTGNTEKIGEIVNTYKIKELKILEKDLEKYKSKTNEEPTNPNSSDNTEKIKSVCASGKNSNRL